MKKLFAVVLAFAFVGIVSAPAFAASTVFKGKGHKFHTHPKHKGAKPGVSTIKS